jgi:hypothetical protein
MINLGRWSVAVFAGALLLCAFPGATGSQEKTPPPNAVTELNIEKLHTDFDSYKKDLEQKLKEIEQRLDRIESLIYQRNHVPRSPESDGRTGDSDLEWCCRHINHAGPCCGPVDQREPCCRHAYREPCCKHVYHVYHPRQVYRPRPCCGYAYYLTPCCVAIHGPERWLSELD